MDEDEGVALAELGLRGARARVFELGLILAMAGIVLLVHWRADASTGVWMSLGIPMIALALGALGALGAGSEAVGMLRSRRYPLVYVACIAVMIGVDLAVRYWLGGDLAAVFSNWAVLIGSASAINLLVMRVPVLTSLHWIDEEQVAQMHPVAIVIAVVVQVAQMGISVLGAPWPVVLVQLLARRVAILPLTHIIARVHYGREGKRRFLANETFEYVASRSIMDASGRIVEPERGVQVVIGAVLIRLPIFAGELMTAGRKSLTRLGDKLVFVEQMLAFSSPTFVVSASVALAHVAFLQTLLGLEGDSAQRSERGASEREVDKRDVAAALGDDWTAFRERDC